MEQDEVVEEHKHQPEIDVASSFGGSINDRVDYTARMQGDDPPTVKDLQKGGQPSSMRNVFKQGAGGKDQMVPSNASSFKKGRDSCLPT